jgi:hypothetical protein
MGANLEVSGLESVEGPPCEGAIEKARQLAHQIVAGEIAPFDGAHQIALARIG